MFANSKTVGDKVLAKLEGATDDAPYFSKRLAKQGRRGSSYAEKRKTSPTQYDESAEHAHLDQFLRD